VGVLIFGFLGNILQLRNIDSNTQLVLKGMIILAAVLLQEGQLGVRWKQIRSYFGSGARNQNSEVRSVPRASA
jgi:simple sugar transport system permease protein